MAEKYYLNAVEDILDRVVVAFEGNGSVNLKMKDCDLG
tara:strand:- start:98 stop:211 length:114 start_codon:yes stop_codon:yes gene_type:complete